MRDSSKTYGTDGNGVKNMRTPTPRIITEAAGPTRFNVGLNLTEEAKVKLEKMMLKMGNLNWRIPRDEVVVEDTATIVNIMSQRPVGRQAIITEGGK